MKIDAMCALAAKLLKLDIKEIENNSAYDKSVEALYVSVPIKGGASLLVGKDGTVLYADSSISYEEHIKEFSAGKRTPLEDFSD